MKRPLRLPAAQLTLPGGFTIRVYYKSDKQCRGDLGEACWGYWLVGPNGGKIILNKDAPEWRRIQTFGHELVHGVHDYTHWLQARVDILKQEAEETARLLAEEDE